MAITYKGMCPCENYEFTLKYISPTEEAVTIMCPFCGVEIDEPEEDEPDDYDGSDDD